MGTGENVLKESIFRILPEAFVIPGLQAICHTGELWYI